MTLSTPRSSRRLRAASFGAIAIASALTLSGCSGSDTPSADGTEGTLRVVTTTTQLTDFASEVGGENIELTGLLTPGASAHSFDPPAADLLALGEADVLVVNGYGLEPFIDSIVEASGFKGEIITASDGIDEAEAKAIVAQNEAEAGHAEEEAGHSEEEAGHAEEEAGHEDHGDMDPHIWMSPHFAEGMVSEIAEGFGKADPDHAADYTERADAYVGQLQDLDEWVSAEFKKVPEADRVLVSGHDSLGYYLNRYGIAFAGSILPSFEDNAEPSAAEIDALVKNIKERGVKAVFVESSMNPKLAQTIAKDAGVKVVDGELLYSDSLGTAESGADTYISATIHNTQLILDSWGVMADEVPANLQG